MTEALDAMVKAMEAEMKRQGDEYLGALDRMFRRGSREEPPQSLDLEKIARAGLKALADLPCDAGGIFDEADEFEVYGMPALMGQSVFDNVLGKILETKS